MPRKTQFTVDDVVEAAFCMVRKSGWAELSVTALAKQMGCSTMPIYSHFENLETLKDEVVRKSWELAMEYEAKRYTGDVWVDHAIGLVHFAGDEKFLFTCMFDGRNLELKREMMVKHWAYLAEHLADYEGFKGLSEEQRQVIRYSRAMLTSGLAVAVSSGGTKFLKEKGIIEKYITVASQAILEGYRQLYDRRDEDVLLIDGHFKKVNQMIKQKLQNPE